MLVHVGNKTFSFVFRYNEEVQNPRKHNETCKETQCIIREGTGEEAEELARASSYCALGDTFYKQCGRLKAFTRVLKTLNFDRTTRGIFWMAYEDMIHGNWRKDTKKKKKVETTQPA